jgi:hypothetical protein
VTRLRMELMPLQAGARAVSPKGTRVYLDDVLIDDVVAMQLGGEVDGAWELTLKLLVAIEGITQVERTDEDEAAPWRFLR